MFCKVCKIFDSDWVVIEPNLKTLITDRVSEEKGDEPTKCVTRVVLYSNVFEIERSPMLFRAQCIKCLPSGCAKLHIMRITVIRDLNVQNGVIDQTANY